MKRRWLLACVLVAMAGSPAAVPAQQRSPLDEELLRSLRGAPPDEARDPRFDPMREAIGPQGVIDRPEQFREMLERELGAAAEKEADNPLVEVARTMRDAAARIVRLDAGAETQSLQRAIVSRLDELIQQAQQRAAKMGSPSASSSASRAPVGSSQPQSEGGNQPSRQPAAESQLRTASDGPPSGAMPAEALGALIKQLWGELPAQARQTMRTAPVEDILPKYQELIEEYFRRLARRR